MAHYANHNPATTRLLHNIPFFAALSPGEAETVEQLLVRKRFVRGQVVLFEEDSSNYMYIIFSGKVKVVQHSSDGKERLLAIHKRGDYFGELSIFDGKTAPATVVSMEESEIGLIARNDIEGFIHGNEEVLFQILSALCMQLRESWSMLKIMSFADAEHRVRAVLKSMGKRYGVKEQRGVLVTLKLTHKDIANYAAVSRETVTRLIQKFIQSGEIEILENRCILIKTSFMKNNQTL